LDRAPGGLLHLRPGAEIVGTTGSSAVRVSSPSINANTLAVPKDGVLVLPSTTVPGTAPTRNTLVFSSATTLTPVDGGTFTAAYTITATSPLGLTGETSIAITSAVATGTLTSSVAGNISLSDGTVSSFSANSRLPALPRGATLTFAGPGTLA